MNRRQFIYGATTMALMPFPGFAEGARQQWLTTAKLPSGQFAVLSVDSDLQCRPLLTSAYRLHGLAVSPDQRFLLAPARRPGSILYIADLEIGETKTLPATPGRHFYGHAVFSADGKQIFTTENEFDSGRGIIGIYDLASLKRLGELASGGIGPHELLLHPDQESLVIANGGILTHPDTGRQKLNLGDMTPNITRLTMNGQIVAQTTMPAGYRDLSLRHIAMDDTGMVYCGMQDQMSRRDALPLVWSWDGKKLVPLPAPDLGWSIFKGYIGSMAFRGSDDSIWASAPRANKIAHWQHNICHTISMHDACGISSHGPDMLVTSGTGTLSLYRQGKIIKTGQTAFAFDNHASSV